MNQNDCATLSSGSELPHLSPHPPSLGGSIPAPPHRNSRELQHHRGPAGPHVLLHIPRHQFLPQKLPQEQQLFILAQGVTNSPSLAVLGIGLDGLGAAWPSERFLPVAREMGQDFRPSPNQTQGPTPAPGSSAAQLANNPNNPHLPPSLSPSSGDPPFPLPLRNFHAGNPSQAAFPVGSSPGLEAHPSRRKQE